MQTKTESENFYAVISVFPRAETLNRFIHEQDSNEKLESLIEYAHRNGVIPGKSSKDFEDFIAHNSLKEYECSPPPDMTFEKLIEDRQNILKFRHSVRQLVNKINEAVEENGLVFPEISYSMFSRLKKTSPINQHRKDTLRCFAFWLGLTRPELKWNYEKLLKICPTPEKAWDENKGVRIFFGLHNRGETIDEKPVRWLRNELHSIRKELEQDYYGKLKPPHSVDTITFALDLPNEETPENRISHPSSYRKAVNNAISVAHEISIRWSLSPYCSVRRFLTVGIAAIEMGNSDFYLQSMLKVKIPGAPVIRMTDFIHNCVIINDIKGIFCRNPVNIEFPNGAFIDVWWFTSMWSITYWDFCDTLLDDQILPRSPENLKKLLWFPEEEADRADIESNAIITYYRNSHNSILGVEIAKTLFFRGQFFEADEILRLILSKEPANLIARTLRMMIFWNLGLKASLYTVADYQFNRSENEADYIKEISVAKDEDFYCEYGLGRVARALTIFRKVKAHGGKYLEREKEILLKPEDVFQSLKESEDIFEKGMTVSPTGHRSLFWFLCVRCLRRLFRHNPDFITDPEKKIADLENIFFKTAKDIFIATGWMEEDEPSYENMKKKIVESHSCI